MEDEPDGDHESEEDIERNRNRKVGNADGDKIQ